MRTQLEEKMAKRSHGKKKSTLKFPDWNTPKPPTQPPPPRPTEPGCDTGPDVKKVIDLFDRLIKKR